ncbi:MAG: hypothetical protein CVU13_03885 [Bacteroidetes bacterium HGW-Bacteroidetes-8]|jgi:CubicO group peptidase (beta-lactamase class C family)|nr:MAG: hypothetical protein CVU13_03885 [Bacteroidetes bacterium HGW-Bacteroidetes-8]
METNKIIFRVLMMLSFAVTSLSAVGQSSSEIDELCRTVFKEWNLPGMSIVVVKDGKMVFLEGYGKSTYKPGGEDITPDTQFVIASTSKAFTSALLATVMDKYPVKWSDTVVNHLPDFRLYDPWVTANFLVRDIMVHKTGFNAYAADDLPHFGYNRDEIYTLLRHIEPTHSFRTTYAYNNVLYTVSAKIIEKYTGMSWDDAIVKNIFTPLQMNSSTTGNRSYFTSTKLAKGHRHYKDGDSIKFALREDTQNGYRWLSAIAPAGFVISTARDMGNWLKMHLEGGVFNGTRVISKENHSYLFTPQTISGWDSTTVNNYAQGWTIEQSSSGRLIRHTGLAYGYTALVGMVPELKMGFAILTNAGNTTNPHLAIARELIEMYRGKDEKNWREHYLSQFMKSTARGATREAKDSVAPKRVELYTGSYFKENFGDVRISLKEGRLFFALKDASGELTHKNGDTFNVNIAGAGNIEVQFFPGINIPIESLTFKIGDPIGKFYKRESLR